MSYLSSICFMCLKEKNQLQTEYLIRAEDCTVTQIKYVLPEITLDPVIPLYICSTCHKELNSFYTFKKLCLENYCRLTYLTKLLQNSSDATRFIKQEKEMGVDFTSETSEDQHDPTDNFVTEDDNVDIKEIEFVGVKEPNLHQQLLTDIKKENDNDCLPNLISENVNEVVGGEMILSSHTNHDNEIQNENSFCKNIVQMEKNYSSNMTISSAAKDDVCPTTSILKQYLMNHLKNIECAINKQNVYPNLILSKELDMKNKIKRYECKICSKKFKKKYHLSMHMKTHTGVKDFPCSNCDRKFALKSNLNKHMKIHNGIKDFECSICDKKFTQRNSLNMHIKMHNGIKDLECTICNRKFIQRSHLYIHMKLHNGDKNFECSVCNQKFVQNSHLNVHMKRHTGIKDFHCNTCDKKFIRKNDLKVHLNIHTGSKEYHCSFCDKKFSYRSSLNAHMKMHDNIKDFEIIDMHQNVI